MSSDSLIADFYLFLYIYIPDITLTGVSRRSLSADSDNDFGIAPLDGRTRHKLRYTYTKPPIRDHRSRKPFSRDSFGTVDSLSTIPSRKDQDSQVMDDSPDVGEVYAELQDINHKMKVCCWVILADLLKAYSLFTAKL